MSLNAKKDPTRNLTNDEADKSVVVKELPKDET